MLPPDTEILVVDDHDFIRKIMVDLLRTRGFTNVRTAENGDAAFAMLKQKPVDAVISDYDMPVMNGIELVKAMRNDPALRHIPVVIVSATPGLELVALSAGVDAYMPKPPKIDEVLKAIEQAIEARKSS